MERNSDLSLEIKGLFGYKNVVIDLSDEVKIFIGENGIGKTSILNILYYVFKGNYYSLQDINFQSIVLYSGKKRGTEVEKDWLVGSDAAEHFNKRRTSYNIMEENIDNSIVDLHVSYNRLTNFLDEDVMHRFINEVIYGDENPREFLNSIDSRYYPAKSPNNRINAFLMKDMKKLSETSAIDFIEQKKAIESFRDQLSSYLRDDELMYFPTYRRIEEDLNKLGIRDVNKKNKRTYGYEEEEEMNSLIKSNEEIIQFGMKDVEQQFEEIKDKISDNSLKSYSKVTGNMIKQLVNFSSEIDIQKMLASIRKNLKDLNIVLERVGRILSKEEIENILKLVQEDYISKDEHKHLIYFLYNLIKNYNQYREYDDSIKAFCEACNNYLVDKKFNYNETEIDIYITNDYNGENVKLNQLSSGEKQIVSILSKIYFSSKNLFILFDEPELSLSIEWQEMLLPHIMDSKKCKQLIAVTHSPFIFNNRYKNNVSTITEASKVVENE